MLFSRYEETTDGIKIPVVNETNAICLNISALAEKLGFRNIPDTHLEFSSEISPAMTMIAIELLNLERTTNLANYSFENLINELTTITTVFDNFDTILMTDAVRMVYEYWSFRDISNYDIANQHNKMPPLINNGFIPSVRFCTCGKVFDEYDHDDPITEERCNLIRKIRQQHFQDENVYNARDCNPYTDMKNNKRSYHCNFNKIALCEAFELGELYEGRYEIINLPEFRLEFRRKMIECIIDKVIIENRGNILDRLRESVEQVTYQFIEQIHKLQRFPEEYELQMSLMDKLEMELHNY